MVARRHDKVFASFDADGFLDSSYIVSKGDATIITHTISLSTESIDQLCVFVRMVWRQYPPDPGLPGSPGGLGILFVAGEQGSVVGLETCGDASWDPAWLSGLPALTAFRSSEDGITIS